MINDPNALQEIRDGWDFVCRSRNMLVGNCNVATIAIGFNQKAIRELGFNLLLASSFSVLEHALQTLRDQGLFSSRSNALGSLMTASKSSLPWVDWVCIDAGRDDRNKSIHERKYLPHAKCRDYIAAIEVELAAWSVLPTTNPKLWHW